VKMFATVNFFLFLKAVHGDLIIIERNFIVICSLTKRVVIACEKNF
jgi:hypothetical protein